MIKKNPIQKDNILNIYTDGASRGNPGPASCSFIFLKNSDTKPFLIHSEYLGKMTNNAAEYEAIIRALNCATEYTRWNVRIYSDSELTINHINGDYRIKKPHLKERLQKILQLIRFFEKVEFFHVPKTNKFIKICDTSCNKRLNEIAGKN